VSNAKTAEPIEILFGGGANLCGPKNPYQMGVNIFEGRRHFSGCPPHRKALGVFAAVCINTAEPIEMPFGG